MAVIEVDVEPLEKLLEAGMEVLVRLMTKGSLDEKGKALHDTLRRMTEVLALAKFDSKLPRPVKGNGGGGEASTG